MVVKVTLSDIAKRVGVSPSTVQRALNGIEGVGDERREHIRRLADEMGYKRNLTAFSLKKGLKTLAVVLPDPANNSRFYARYLWEGALRCREDYHEFLIALKEFSYVRNPESHAAALREALAQHGDRLDGVLTMGSGEPAPARAVAALREQGIPVVFVGTDSGLGNRLCCVRTYDEMAGRMAADLLVNFAEPMKRSKVIMTGDFSIPDQFLNAQGFERHIFESGLALEIIKLSHDPDPAVVREGIREALDSGLGICAAYATSARNTVPMCQAVAECRRQGRVRTIGSDIFPESLDLLRSGRLNAIIHKRPARQAYQAMQALINYVIKGEPPPADSILVDSVIVMRSNLECFTRSGQGLEPTAAPGVAAG